MHSSEVQSLKGDSEFTSFEALSLDEVLESSLKGITDFEESKKWIGGAISAVYL